MKFRRYILFFILMLTFENAFAHNSPWFTMDFGNVRVRVFYGNYDEPTHKIFLLGQLAEELAKQLNYSKPISLDFVENNSFMKIYHYPYFISYDKAPIYIYKEDSLKELQRVNLEKQSIVIRQVAWQFDAETTLKLLEYAILNIDNIKSSQKQAEYEYIHNIWRITSIDTNLIKPIFNTQNSVQINNVLNLRVKKIEREFEDVVSYFLQNNKYTIFARDYDYNNDRETDTNLLTLDDIFNWEKLDNRYATAEVVVFDTDSSFYVVKGYEKKISKRHIIQNLDKHGYYDVVVMSENHLSLTVHIWEQGSATVTRVQTSIYFIEEDELIQDIDALINTNK